MVLFQLFHPQDPGQGTLGAKEWEQPPCLEHPSPQRQRAPWGQEPMLGWGGSPSSPVVGSHSDRLRDPTSWWTRSCIIVSP